MSTTEYIDYVTAIHFMKGSFAIDDLYVDNKNVDLSCGQVICNFVTACRGMIDASEMDLYGDSVIVHIGNNDCCKFISDNLLDKIKIDIEDDKIIIRGTNILEVFDVLYKDARIYKRKHRDYFLKVAYGVGPYDDIPSFRYVKTLPDAVAPTKNKSSDSGFDMVLIRKVKTVGNVAFFDTGIQVAPPQGWYFDLVGRSSISKTGYMLANNVGIIDQSYRGNILVALVKINPEAPELELPARLVQIIPRKVWHMQALECMSLEETARGSGGFGSSGR